GGFHHFDAQLRLEVYADFGHVFHATMREQLFGANAERADRAGVHPDRYAHLFPFALRPVASGSPSFSHSPMPPRRLKSCSKPSFFSLVIAVRERAPVAQQMISGESLSLPSSGRRRSSSDSGKWRAFGMWPWEYSVCSRMSMTMASSRLILAVASAGASEVRSVAERIV